MVAAIDPRKTQLLTVRELNFCREFAANGGNASAAYRVAYRYKGQSSDVIACEVMGRPHIKAHLQALRDSIGSETKLTMSERRDWLAKFVRDKRRFPAPDVGQRLACIREDAILAGERNETATITADVTLLAVYQALERVAFTTQGGSGVVVDMPSPDKNDILLHLADKQPQELNPEAVRVDPHPSPSPGICEPPALPAAPESAGVVIDVVGSFELDE